MSRLTRKSIALTQARIRLDRLRAIDAAMDLGGDLSAVRYEEAITTGEAALSAYNQHLSAGDELLNTLEKAEANVAELSSRMLAAIAAHYGKDSPAYEQAGGTRTSERKRRRRTPPGGSQPPETPPAA